MPHLRAIFNQDNQEALVKKAAPESNLEETRKTTPEISAGRVVQAEGIADTKAGQGAVWKAAGSPEGLEPSEADTEWKGVRSRGCAGH